MARTKKATAVKKSTSSPKKPGRKKKTGSTKTSPRSSNPRNAKVLSRGGKRKIGIRDRLGQLTYRGACRLMGDEDGEARLRQGAKFEIDLPRDVRLTGDTFRVDVPDPELRADGFANVIIVEMTSQPQGLHLTCTQCQSRCHHIAAALGLVLDEKSQLGLAAPPDPNEPIENLTEGELIRRALADREERAAVEPMLLKTMDRSTPWTDYTITSRHSGRGKGNGDRECRDKPVWDRE